MKQSLFGHLATRFATSPENLATEALNYILNRSLTAKRTFLRYISQIGISISDDLIFKTQSSTGEGTIPDLVGVDSSGMEVLIGEAKFWAGLTENQPVGYLKRLPKDANAVLLFIAPVRRFSTLWPELIRRCNEAGVIINELASESEELQVGKISDFHVLAIASWRSILNVIRLALEREGQPEVASDVLQLQGLCERMDDDAFLPIQSEELSSSIGTRVYQYHQLVDDVTSLLAEEGLASLDRVRATPAYGRYTRYMKIGNFGCGLQFNSSWWSSLRETPLWLSIKGIEKEYWVYSEVARERLAKFEMESPPRLFQIGDELLVPLFPPINVEKGQVIEALLAQVREIAGHLGAESP